MRTVLFDCDSTLTAIEGVDILARGHREEVRHLTEAAMRGEVPLEQVYGRRLEIIRPDRAAVESLARAYREALVPDAVAVVGALRAAGVDVRIISGGLLPAVAALAAFLDLPAGAVAAVDITFDASGAYAGWERSSPLARAGGKADVIRAWEPIPRPAMLVGDGATDLEAKGAVDLFVGYAGVIARENVLAGADVVLRTPSLAPVLALALRDEDAAGEAAALYRRGRDLLDDRARERWLSEKGFPS